MLKFGPGGTAGLGYSEGLAKISELKLGALEVEFTYGVRMNNDEAKKIGEMAKKLKIALSIHAPYYINLNSDEKQKIGASRTRILQSVERGHYLNATNIVFHPGFYQKKPKKDSYDMIKEQILKLQDFIREKRWAPELAPETTGKASQFGDLDELLDLRKETGCNITVDFSHLKARNNGKIDYDDVFNKLKPLKELHCHFSGIEWTAKGERRHLLTQENYIKELLLFFKKYNKSGTIINESPDPIGDASKMKRVWDKLPGL